MIHGLRLILLGLFKKMVIADSLAPYVNEVYGQPGIYGGNMSLLAVLLFSIQIYCDFSGYSDIAIGSARCMGFKLMKNFDQPYFSYSITEFWRRWHISLSTWFSDYLFTPIATSLRDWGKRAVVFGLFFTFFISGLWHGAGWTYIIWGLLHGLAMSYEFLTKKTRKKVFKNLPGWLSKSVSMLLTFSYVTFALIFFRASSVQNALSVIGSVSFHPSTFLSELNVLAAKLNEEIDVNAYWQYTGWMLLLFLLIELLYRRSEWPDLLQKMPRPARWVVYYSIIAFIFLFGVYKVTPDFIYFQF
jgi:D-alanyl-lipoteichoic acid acyltransferase DltB (MBOAT superfamily)